MRELWRRFPTVGAAPHPSAFLSQPASPTQLCKAALHGGPAREEEDEEEEGGRGGGGGVKQGFSQ